MWFGASLLWFYASVGGLSCSCLSLSSFTQVCEQFQVSMFTVLHKYGTELYIGTELFNIGTELFNIISGSYLHLIYLI